MFHFEKKRSLSALVTMALGLQTLHAQTDPMPYDSIAHPLQANPISDTSIQTRVDLANLTMNPVRVNQAGYRLVDVQEGRAQFYVVGTTLPTFEVLDMLGAVRGNGALKATGLSATGQVKSERTIDAARSPNPMYRGYPKTGAISSGTVWVGTIPATVPPGRYQIKTPLGTSVPFVVSANLYGMVRDATIKFFGIQRAGSLADETGLITDTLYSPSWFRSKPAHTWDGWNIDTMGAGAAKYRYKGKLSGGWYDCGDHLKETRTQSFALAILGSTAATMPEKDADSYGFNHNDTRRTDGIPDIVREARWGSQFALKAWRLSGGSMGGSTVDSTKLFLSVGDFGKDHGWWGQPQNQDVVVPDRGGRQNRPARIDYGSSSLSDWAAGLAFASRLYRPFDRTGWCDTALKAAKDMYELAKKVNRLESSPAYSGESMSQDDMALASTALYWATKEKKYLDETILTPGLPNGKGGTCGGNQAATFPGSHFEGGFFGCTSDQMRKSGANTDWASVQSVALYTFFKLFLQNKDTAAAYGINDAQRGLLAQRTMANLMANLSARSQGTAGQIRFPQIARSGMDVSYNLLNHDSLWYTMQTQQEWVWNRYQMGNLAELYMYWDMTRYMDPSQITLPDLPTPIWSRDKVERALINGTNVILGMNPWDMSMLLGVGAKNPGHPHHRAANPEGKNVPGANYNYRVPVGALYGGITPGTATTQLFEQWENWRITETCLDGSAVTLLALTGLAENVPNEAPKMDVKVLNTTDTLALVQVDLDKWGTVKLEYGTDSLLTGATKVVLGKDTSNSVLLRIHRLAPSTKYWFKVTATDLAGKTRTQWAWVGSPTDSVRYNFTTKALPLPPAVYGLIKACNVTSDSADIMWYTPNGEYLSSVMFADSANWKAGNYRYVNVDQSGPAPVKFHHVRLYGLKERTTYYFRVGEPGGPYNDEVGCFRTPITDYKFKVYAGQYTEGSGFPMLSLNVVNEEERTFDSLSLRFYVRSTDTLWKSPGVPHTVYGPTPTLDPVPLTFENSIGVKYDICQAYNSAGFNRPCDDIFWGLNWSWGNLSSGVFMLKPVKIPGSYDAATNTWGYYLEMPLGPTVMNSQSRIRFDARLVARSEWPNPINQGNINSFNFANSFVNRTVNVPTLGDRKWWDEAGPNRASLGHTFVTRQDAPLTTTDWSWKPHSVAAGDPVDYPGMLRVAKDSFDIIRPEEAVNPYVAVYRKGVFVYGFSPDKKEQATKRTVFAMDVKYDAPFDVRNGGTINLESSASSRLTGTVDVYDQLIPTAKGFVTGIWVNGVELTAAQRRAAISRNPNGTWKLDLPLRLYTGTNKVDVTIFAGADSTETVDTDVCDEGKPCAFKNSFWFVNSISKLTPSQIAVFDASANPASKVTPDSSIVRVRVTDGNANKSSSVVDAVTVKLVRGGIASGTLTLVETGVATGIFELPVSVVSGTAAAGQVKVLPGDTVVISYQDADDTEDTVSTSIFAVSTWPTPERGGIFRSCGGTYEARVRFDRALGSGNPSTVTVVLRNAPNDSTTLVVPGASTTFDATTRTLSIPLAGVPENGSRMGRAAIAISDLSGATKVVSQALSDSVGPWIDSAKIVENLEGRLTDTIAVWVSEPMVAPSKTWFFSVTRGGTALPTAAVVVDTAWLSDLATGRWTVVVRTGIVKAGDFLRLVPAQVRDLRGNAAEDCPTLERELKVWVRQAPVSRAWIRDANGDGTADQVVVVYKRALRASEAPGSIRVRFGAADSVRDAVVAPVSGDSVVTISLPVAYSRGLTSGKAADGSGTVTLFKAGDSVLVTLTDSVGPALLSARLNYGDAATDTVVLSFSEPVVSVAGTSWMQILKAAATNLAISGVPVAVDPTTWKVAVDTGSVVPGDSVRPASAGRFQDARGKGAAILHPWIEVQGDDRPPARAWYSDVDGDGSVDRITMVWARAPRTKPSFLLMWPSTTGGFDTVDVASAAWVLQADGRSTIVNVGPFDFGVTSSPTTDLGRQISNGVATSFAIHDSVPPRLLTARLAYDGGTALQPADTLKIVFSEPVAVDLSSSGLEKLIAPATLPVGYRPQVLSADGRSWNIPVDTLSIFPGDSIRPSALVGFSDGSGNRPSVLHPWVSVEGAERPPLRAWMKDVDGDGAADQVTVLWARGPRTAPALSFLWPNGRGGFDSVGVAAGSWTLQPDGVSAVLAVGPFAVGVTSSPTTDLGRQTSAGTITSFPVHDSIAAVMTSARLGYAQADGLPDTLHLTWSEPIVWTGVDPLAVVRTGLAPRPVRGTRTVLRPDFQGAVIELDPLDSTLTVFRSGDQIRLSPASAGTVADRFGNVVEDPTRWVPVVLGRRPPRFQITFDPNKLKYKDWVIAPGPGLKLYVKSATSPDWIDFETGNVADGVVLKEQGLGPVISLNQPLRGKALLYDNQGTFVANVDLDLLGEAFYAGKLPMDASNQYQVKIQWNGTASTGKPAASGVYLMRLVLWQNVAGEDEEPEYRVVNQVYKCGWEVSVKK